MAALVRSLGLPLLDRSGKPHDIQQLTSADVIAFYFSAHWCPPCRHFTPVLKKFVETLQSNGEQSLKVIFVSSDQSEHDMWKYMYDSHGDWFALAYSCRDGKERLERQYQVSGIPQLVVIDAVGRQAVRDARGEVMAASSSSTQVLTTYLGWKTAVGATPSAPVQPRPLHGELLPGLCVRICGLQGAPEHNGCEGTVRGFDPQRQRYVVQLGEKSLSLRAANLLQLPVVQVRSGEDSTEWFEAGIADFDVDTGELIWEQDGKMLRGRLGDPSAPRLKAGTRIVVQGLQAETAKQWNEHIGQVLEYLVQVAPDAQLKIRPGNIRIFPLP
uniref:Thioredoxin domain-containing protein n=1 Tax=Alexandrium monilatum TaxID=311494 RepID=A0A7S4Q0V3_9DINO|mmetsp:Transcript_89962/g.284810  ORF Transcript_89962/g.284810 Transcript_89962/m.284810 type:complete len:328 (+) Transcript_89962:87-1070(+)